MTALELQQTPLGKASSYISSYQPTLLCPILRQIQRDRLGIQAPLPFRGVDIWNAYEISWLNSKGKPMVAMAECHIPCESPYLIESKSFKLYLNSYNQTVFESWLSVEQTLTRDLTIATGAAVLVKLMTLDKVETCLVKDMQGFNLDELDISCDTYQPTPAYLTTSNHLVTETLYSHLLKSNCLVTGQPDWGSIQISYTGNQIQHEGLLKYLVSFREHQELHEHCVERIFLDIIQQCAPKELSVQARYTRRGGLDINPYRSNVVAIAKNERTIRQ